MEKKLLLLGLLQSREMHGYEINKLLEHSCAIPIDLKKSNGYRLLSRMEKDGWVTHRSEKEGNRPRRRVYSVTEKGKRAFLKLLRENLSSLSRPEFFSLVGIDLMGFLPPEEKAALLSRKLKLLKEHYGNLDQISEGVRNTHPGIEYMHRYYRAEIEWIEGLISDMKEDP